MNQGEERLVKYLKDTTPPEGWSRRIFCCDSSRSLYCPMCCSILLPKEDYPPALREGRLQLPFDLDIILDVKERRTSATGVQLKSVINAATACRETESQEDPTTSVNLYDLAHTTIPDYETSENQEGVYVLFPSTDSVPISSVSPKKLVVLDIKWNKLKVTLNPSIAGLPKVHLTSPPSKSQFWRWHNAGKGMLSTIEAVYFAALETTEGLWPEEDRSDLVHLLWLFAIQRSVMHQKSEAEERLVPFSEEAKAERRALREKQNGNPPKKRYPSSNLFNGNS